MIGQVPVLVLIGTGASPDENDVARLHPIADFVECLLDLGFADAGALLLPGEVEHDSVGVAQLERDAFRSRTGLADVPEGIDMCTDVVAQHHHRAGCQLRRTVLRGADPFSELLPRLVHGDRWPYHARERDHVVVDGHTEID